MSLELQIIRLQEFIRLGPSGKFDPEGSKAALAVLASACLRRGIHQALLDLRALQHGPKPVFSPDQLISLVNTFREIGFTSQHRLAVLYIFDPHQRARMFASIARLRGWTVKAFNDFEQAVAWLFEAPRAQTEPQTLPTTRERNIPIRKSQTPPKPAKREFGFQPIIQKKPRAQAKPLPMQASQPAGQLNAGIQSSPLHH